MAGPGVLVQHPVNRQALVLPARVLFFACRANVPDPLRFGRPGESSLYGYQFERMGLLDELRHPTQWYTKVAIAILSLALFALLAATAVSGYVVYRITSPPHSTSNIDLQNLPGHPEKLNFTVSGGPRDGWFFPGLKSAPTVILCPGYESSRAVLLTLASALQDQQYNVLVFDFSGQGSAGGHTTLGLQEIGELHAAMNAVANRGDVDMKRFGLWGENMGAYVALAEAVSDTRVRAVAVESPYSQPKDMIALQVTRTGLGSVPVVTRMSQMIFGWINSKGGNAAPLNAQIIRLSGVPQLYLEAPEEPVLAASTSQLFQISSPPHELVVLAHGNYGGMLDDEKRTYENRIVSFFLVNLPVANP